MEKLIMMKFLDDKDLQNFFGLRKLSKSFSSKQVKPCNNLPQKLA